jgi:hypothetical protein
MRMAIIMRDNFGLIRFRVRVSMCIKMVLVMKEVGIMINSMDMESNSGRIIPNMLVIIIMVISRETVHSIGRTTLIMLEISRIMSFREKVLIIGQMAGFILVIGIIIRCMVIIIINL